MSMIKNTEHNHRTTTEQVAERCACVNIAPMGNDIWQAGGNPVPMPL